jgi:hypothetical protein
MLLSPEPIKTDASGAISGDRDQDLGPCDATPGEQTPQIVAVERAPALGRAPATLKGQQMAETAHDGRGGPFMRQTIAFGRVGAPGGLLVLAPAGALRGDQAPPVAAGMGELGVADRGPAAAEGWWLCLGGGAPDRRRGLQGLPALRQRGFELAEIGVGGAAGGDLGGR